MKLQVNKSWLVFIILVVSFIWIFDVIPLPFGYTKIDSIEFNCIKEPDLEGKGGTAKCEHVKGSRFDYIEKKELEKGYYWGNREVHVPLLIDRTVKNPIHDLIGTDSKIFQEYEVCIKKLKTITNGKKQVPSDVITVVLSTENIGAVHEKVARAQEPSCKEIVQTGSTIDFEILTDIILVNGSGSKWFPRSEIQSPKLKLGEQNFSRTTAEIYIEPKHKLLPLIVYIGSITIVGGLTILLEQLNTIFRRHSK